MNVPSFITDILGNFTSLHSRINITSVLSRILGTSFFQVRGEKNCISPAQDSAVHRLPRLLKLYMVRTNAHLQEY